MREELNNLTFFIKYYQGDKINKDKMGGAFITHGRDKE
jgi:hypothetical protein